jgi:thiamine-phosphate pyrophosphorylase
MDAELLRLVAITDDLHDGVAGLVARAAGAVRGGATMIQLRLKDADARTMVEVARALGLALPAGVPVVVNDRLDVALAAGASGVHVGPNDLPATAVRRLVPPGFIVGASVGSDAEIVLARDADYVGIGPLYDTTTKPDAGAGIGAEAFARLARSCRLPAVAIGGIDATNASAALRAGAAGVAVIRAVMGAREPEAAARAIRAAMAGGAAA